MKLNPHLTPYTKVKSNWTQNLSWRAKAIKLLNGNIDVNLSDFGLGSVFLDINQKHKQGETDKMNFIKVKNFCVSRMLSRKWKDTPQNEIKYL
jgi:hypothetical protein